MQTNSQIRVVSRRSFVIGSSTTIAALISAPGWAQLVNYDNNGWLEMFNALVDGSEQIDDSPIHVNLPTIADNGSQVQISVSVEPMDDQFPKSASIFVPGNPRPFVGKFNFYDTMGNACFTSRIRLHQTQDIVVVADMGNGKMAVQSQNIEVTIGGCVG